jgi:hypothetical protein
VLTTLAVYASFVAIAAVPAQLVVLLWQRRGWRRVTSALAVCAVCWIPLAVLAANRGSGQLFWIPSPSLTTEKQAILALTSAGFEPNYRAAALATVLAIATVLLLLAAAARIVIARDRPALLALSWLIVPVALLWLESLVGQSVFIARNLHVSLPAAALLLGWLLTRSRPAWIALAVVIALRALVLAPSYGTSPEDWRAATAYVQHAARPGDCVAFYPLDARMPFAYYAQEPLRPYVERYETPRLPSGCLRVWLVASHQGSPTGPPGSRAHYARYVAIRAALARAYPRQSTRTFGYASVIWAQLFSR